MRKCLGLSIVALMILSSGIQAGREGPFPKLRGPYLGQKAPGRTPQPFAPGIISTDEDEGSSGFALNGTAFLFQKFLDGICRTFIMRLADGFWTPPEQIPFSDTMSRNGDFVFSSDDKTMLYQVKTETGGLLASDIWKAELKASGWGDRAPLPTPINSPDDESYASDTPGGTVYFFSNRRGGKGRFDLYMCPFKEGRYGDAVNLESLNTEYNEWDPFVSPDESCLIFCSTRPGGLGMDDLYITFKGADGRWGPAKNMGAEINSPGSENRPYLSHDGKYFFFTSTRNGNRDTFWGQAEFIDRFRN
ncbi:MAG: hypothetical protein WCC00_12035 [Candidatus Aminicenantales bacterium]